MKDPVTLAFFVLFIACKRIKPGTGLSARLTSGKAERTT